MKKSIFAANKKIYCFMRKIVIATTALLGVGIGAVLLKKWLGNKPLKADVVSENAPAISDEPCSVCANV